MWRVVSEHDFRKARLGLTQGFRCGSRAGERMCAAHCLFQAAMYFEIVAQPAPFFQELAFSIGLRGIATDLGAHRLFQLFGQLFAGVAVKWLSSIIASLRGRGPPHRSP